MADVGHRSHVLVIVQNLPVPLDRRVWLECQALIAAGFNVSVICPKGPGDPVREQLKGVWLYKYKPAPEAKGLPGYVIEFIYSWIRTAILSVRVAHWQRIDIIQACNPPDTYWLLALLWKIVSKRRVKFVFDHHDLNPEVFVSRFGRPSGVRAKLQYQILLWLESRTFRIADRVISTNESYREVALKRGRVGLERTAVVRSGPDTASMRPGKPEPELKRSAKFLIVYLGIMGPQDGVEGVVEMADYFVNRLNRRDVHFALLGFGDCLADLQEKARLLGLDEFVRFTGRVGFTEINSYLSTADVGLVPDPMNPLNDVSTMNKTMEYMAYGLPVVGYRLTENSYTVGDCGILVPPGDTEAFIKGVVQLLDNPELRDQLGSDGRSRCVNELDWKPQAERYVAVYKSLDSE